MVDFLTIDENATIRRLLSMNANGVRTLFDAGLAEDFYRWVIERIILHRKRIGASNETDQVAQVLEDMRSIAFSDLQRWQATTQASLGSFDEARYKDLAYLSNREEIAYSVMAMTPEFITDHTAYRDWIIERRFRALIRLREYANRDASPGVGHFFYRHACHNPARNKTWHVNEAAELYWGFGNKERSKHPFILSSLGQVDPERAIDLLFTVKPACYANLFDCAFTAVTMLLDSLMSAKDPGHLFKSMTALQPTTLLKENYVAIDHPDSTWVHYSRAARDYYKNKGAVPAYHMITDKQNNSLFTWKVITLDELQTGDRTYIYNHPLYLTFEPTGAWRGEHSFVWSLRSRKRADIRFEGFGMEDKSITDLYKEHIADLNTRLNILQRMTAIHLGSLARQRAGTALPLGVKVSPVSGAAGQHNYLYISDPSLHAGEPDLSAPHPSLPARYRDYAASDTVEIEEFEVVQIDPRRFRIVTVWTTGSTSAHVTWEDLEEDEQVVVHHKDAAASPTAADFYDLVNWGVTYTNRSDYPDPETDFFDLAKHYLAGSAFLGSRVVWTDLFRSPFYINQRDRLKPVDLTVTRPKVRIEASYLSHLSTIGAL